MLTDIQDSISVDMILVLIIVSNEDQSHDVELFLQDLTFFLKHKIVL